MGVVSNSSPLIALARIQRLDLLPAIFESVLIPPAVAREIAPSIPVPPKWLRIQTPSVPPPASLVRRRLGDGEWEALALAIELKADWIILDDLPARRSAEATGLNVMGTLGTLLTADPEPFHRTYTSWMPEDLLLDAREQAERSAPAVRSAALLHIARVLTKVNPAEARRLLDQGLALAATLPEDDRDILVGEGAVLAATVSPQRAFQLAREVSVDRESVVTQMLFRMLDHGYIGDAVAYLSEAVPGEMYPFDAALQAMGCCPDDETRLRVFRGAIRAMREQRSPSRPFSQHHFVRLFTYHWTRLPAEEAKVVVQNLVQSILSEPDQRTNARFSSGSQTVHFSSTHEQRLFEILGPLRHLDADLAASVARDYPQLSAAAERFPYGQESMNAAMHSEQPPMTGERVEQPGYIDVGRRLIPIPEAIRTEFQDAFAVALDLYAADSEPDNFNYAPRECWSSALEFRKILYKAGQHEGPAAARYLDRIPDAALRLFAQIELAAALAKLPQLGGRTIRPGPRGLSERMRASRQSAAPSAAPPPMRVVPPLRKPNLPPSRELRISLATLPADNRPSGGSGPDFVEVRNASLKGVVSQLYNMPATRIEWSPSFDPNARYDFVLVLSHEDSREGRLRLMQDGIARHFNARITIEGRPKDVYVLTAPNGIRARPVREEPMFEFGSIEFGSVGIGARSVGSIAIGAQSETRMEDAHPRIPEAFELRQIMDMPSASSELIQSTETFEEMRRRITRQLSAPFGPDAWLGGINASLTIRELCETIEDGLDRPLIDETGLDGTYAINVQTDVTTTADFLRALSDKLGLVATSGRRDVRTLIIRAE